MMRRISLGPLAALFLSSLPATYADEPVVVKSDTAIPPFTAVLKVGSASVHARAEASSPEVGLLREGAIVTVTGCLPDCAAQGAWALLGTDGAIRLSLLRPIDQPGKPESAAPALLAESLGYGRVDKAGIAIYKLPSLSAGILSHRRMPREMAFLPDQKLRATGWFERVEGGFVRARQLASLVPSKYQGVHDPQLPLVLVLRNLTVNASAAGREQLHRYQSLALLEGDSKQVLTDRGLLPRSGVRLVKLLSRPPSIPLGARWVHVDLNQQTLTAYEGDRPVLATLISSGKDERKSLTHPGLYQVQFKLNYSDMHGEPPEPYDVDRVPYVLFFNKNEALHGTYWHDSFGAKSSHGCINLSLADAHWLFDWAPPALPTNWSELSVASGDPKALYVFIQTKASE